MKDKIIYTLPFKIQDEIHLGLLERGLYEEDIKMCFRGKLRDIEDLINIAKYIEEDE